MRTAAIDVEYYYNTVILLYLRIVNDITIKYFITLLSFPFDAPIERFYVEINFEISDDRGGSKIFVEDGHRYFAILHIINTYSYLLMFQSTRRRCCRR